MSSGVEPIICVPTVTACATDDEETATLRRELGAVLDDPAHPEHARYALAPAHVKVEGADEPLTSQAPQPGPPSKAAPALAIPSPAVPQALRGIAPDVLVFDLSSLTYLQMRQMLGAVRRRAAAEPGPLPVIIENHTKYLGDLRPVEKFCELLAASDDVKVITARELARNLRRASIRPHPNFAWRRPWSLRAASTDGSSRCGAIGRLRRGPLSRPGGCRRRRGASVVHGPGFAKASRGTRDRRDPRVVLRAARAPGRARARDDWRYLDAWNNAFEMLDPLGSGESHLPRTRWMLETYAGLLGGRIAALRAAGAIRKPGP